MPTQRGLKKNINWEQIESEYVYGAIIADEVTGKKTNVFPSIADLAKKYGIAESAISIHSTKKNWMVRRNKYLAEFRQKIKKESLRELFIVRNKNAGRILLQVEGCQKLIDYMLGRYVEILEHDNGDNQFDFRDFNLEEIGEISPKDLKIILETIKETKDLMEDILKLDPDLYEEMRGLKEEESEELTKEAKQTLGALEKRLLSKRDRLRKDVIQDKVNEFKPS